MKRKQTPIWLVIVADVILAAGILFGFLRILHGPDFFRSLVLSHINSANEHEAVLPSVPSHDLDRTFEETEPAAENLPNREERTETAFSAENFGGEEIGRFEDEAIRILLTRHTREAEQRVITFYVAEILLRDPSCLTTVIPEGRGNVWPDQLARSAQAILAVNGDYYASIHKGLIVRNGEILQESEGTSDLCVLYEDGSMQMIEAEDADSGAILDRHPRQVWAFGPSLLTAEGKARTKFRMGRGILQANPRTAIGYYGVGHYCFVVVDGRNPDYSGGATLEELSGIFEELGCLSAYNLDGGSSSCMVFRGETVNQPSGGGRPVSDLVIIREKEDHRN